MNEVNACGAWLQFAVAQTANLKAEYVVVVSCLRQKNGANIGARTN